MVCNSLIKRNITLFAYLIFFGISALLSTSCYPDYYQNELVPIEKETPNQLKNKNTSDRIERIIKNGFLNSEQSTFVLDSGTRQVSNNYGNIPVIFEPNRGQFDKRVHYLARGQGFNFFITPSETVLVLQKLNTENLLKNEPLKNKKLSSASNKNPEGQKSVIRMKFIDGAKKNQITGEKELLSKSNYFIGNNSTNWQREVSQFAEVKQKGVYEGIDVLFYGNQNRLEYDLLVGAGADPGKIKIKFEGAENNYIDKEGNLILKTAFGEIRQTRPIAFQEIDGKRIPIDCQYVQLGKNRIGFKTGDYDKTRLLTIDPIIDYSTYLGGTSNDYINDLAVDSAGNVFVTGYTASTNFPTTAGSFRTTSVGATDVFVLKLNSTGTGLFYSTYIGGSSNQSGNGQDYGNSLGIDATGNVYVAGRTGSTNFPLSSARQPTHGGGVWDAFILKLNSTGNTLLYSTYHGGSGEDFANGISVDGSDNAYVTGGTISPNFPVLNAYQSTLGTYLNGSWAEFPSTDIFVSKFNPSGILAYSTYLGGAAPYPDQQFGGTITNYEHGNGIAVDSQGNAFVTGVTTSKHFPMINAVDGPAYDRNKDAFVVKFNATGNGLIYSTYLSGSDTHFFCCTEEHYSDDVGIDIAVDTAGSAYIVGNTQSGNFPTVSPFQGINKSFWEWARIGEVTAHNSVFVTKFNPAGNSLAYSTYLGGSGLPDVWGYPRCAENATGIAVDATGSAYVTGNTCSWDFPLVNPILQPRKNYDFDNDWDAFVTKFTPDGSALNFSSYVGNRGFDQGTSIAVDGAGNAYLAGVTTSTNFPLSAGAFQTNNSGGNEGFVTKIINTNGVNITGRVTRPDGTGSGYAIQVKLSGRIIATADTDAGGNYSFLNLPPNQNYTVEPSPGFFTFQPLSQSFTNLNSNVTADFTINVYQIGGRVTEAGNGVAGITMTLSGSGSKTTQTNANGDYLFTDVLPGSYTVTPSKSADPVVYVFTPQNQSFSNISSNQTANFSVERIITTENLPIADAYVQDGTSANTNFGTATTLKAETDSKANNGKNFDSYLKFDLNSINRSIKSAKLRIYAASSTTGSVTTAAYSVSAVNWTESGTGGITWNNKPTRSASALTGSNTTVTGTALANYDIDITNFIKSEKSAGRNIVSLALHNPSASTLVITANSREAAANRPRLIIITGADENLTPSVTMTAPANGTTFTAPANITVNASATDSDGTISRVDFYNGTSLIGSSTSPVSGSTYSINWGNIAAGSYVLSAIAFDDRGASSTADPINITVNPANSPPSVSLIGPGNNSTFAVGSDISLSAVANDPDGTISQVEFLSGTTVVGTATTPVSGNTYTVVWTNAQTGSYTLTARARDNNNAVTTSSAVNISVVGQIGLSPIADAYVQDGASAAVNFGTAVELRSQISASAGSNRETYLKFDLTQATGITKSVLRLYGRLSDTSGMNVPIGVFPVATTSWVESGNSSLTWNNKPAAGATALTSATIANNIPQWYEWDITSYIQTEKAAGRNTVSFAVKGIAVSNPYAIFNSKEASTNQPQLIMQTTQARNVLMVVGSTTLNTGDSAVRTRLQNMGFTVTVKAAGSTTNTSIKATDADGKALVIVSSTVTPANVAAKLKNIPVPVLNWEFDLADDFGMTGTVSGTDFGTAATQTQAVLTNPAHPMSAGLTGTQTLVSANSTFSWGKPNINADKIAVLTSDSTKSVIYGYDAGKTMFGLEAPARRAAVYLSDTTGASFTTNGGMLFDATVRWASQVNISPTIVLLSPVSGPTGTSVSITGTNFGNLQGIGVVTFNGLTALVSNWSNTSITATVPTGATTGLVIVTAGGVSSNGVAFTVTGSNNDTDGDGLPDSWELLYFGNLNSGALDDPDGDGVTNLQEYLQGRNPTRGTVSNPNAVDLKVHTPLEP